MVDLSIQKVTDPVKIVTDPVLLRQLAKQGIDKDYVEFFQDYAPSSLGKEHSPYAKFYRDLKSGKHFAVISGLPMVKVMGHKIEPGWLHAKGKYYSKANLFSAIVKDKQVQVTCLSDQPDGRKLNDRVIWQPQLFLNGVEQSCGDATLLETDPTNENYHQNVLEWDYGICKRRLRIIEGRVRERWVFESNPHGEVRILHNQRGDYKLKFGQFKVNDDEELIPAEAFVVPNDFFTEYPLDIGASDTFYPDAGHGNTTVDGYCRDLGGASWHNKVIAGGDEAYDDAASAPVVYIIPAETPEDSWYLNARGLLLFLTSSLPDVTLLSGSISLYGSVKEDYNVITPDINIYASTPASNNALVKGDYTKVGTTAFCDTPITYANWKTGDPGDPNVFTLNANGLAAISKTGISKFGARNACYDVADALDPGNHDPTWSHHTPYRSQLASWMADKGSGYKPKLVVTYGPEAPTVTTQAATDVEATTTTGNGNIIDNGGEDCDIRGFVWDLASHGDPGNVSPAVSDYANDVPENNGFGTGAFTGSLTGLPTGDTIYVRAYAHNSEGYSYGDEVSFLTKPAAPTDIWAEDGTNAEHVGVTWTKSTGATNYQVYRDGTPLGWLGDVDNHSDTGADPGTITPGDAAASDGLHTTHVALSLSGQSVSPGTTHTYKVRAKNATGESEDSETDTGHRGTGGLTYQWQRSAADSDADYSNIPGATTASYDDTGAPADGSGRYYRCVENASGAEEQISSVDRGFRAVHYDRSATASLGLLPASSRLGVLTRGDTSLLGLSPTASRTMALTRSKSGLLGLLPSVSRIIALTRTDVGLLGLLTTGSRAIIFTAQSATALLGLLPSGTRVMVLTRSDIVLLGLKGIGARVIVYAGYSATALLGLKPTANRVLALIRGLTGFALSFDGEDDYVDCGNGASLNLTDVFTFELWIEPTKAQEICYTPETGGNVGVAAKVESNEGSTTWSWQLRFGSPENCRLGFQLNTVDYGAQWATAKEDLVLNERYHIVGVFDGSTIKFYLNSVLKDTNTLAGPTTIKSYLNKLLICSDGWSEVTGYFKGLVDEVRIYHRAHLQEEITYNYNGGAGREIPYNQTGLVGWWHFDEGKESIVYDKTANHNDGTVIGASWVKGFISLATVVGLKATGLRTMVLTRADAALLGLKTTASRVIAFTPHSATALFGLTATATRTVVLTRASTALLGLKSTASRVITIIRAATALLGYDPTGGAVVHYIRTATAYLGLKATGVRVVVLTRVDTALFGLKGTASRVLNLIRADATLLGLKTTASRVVAYSRANTALLGLKGTASRVITLIRGGTAILGYVPTGGGIVHYIRTATAYLGLKATGVRTLVLNRVDTALLGLLATGSRVIVYAGYTATALLGLLSTGARAISYSRTNTAVLGLKEIATRVVILTRADSALLGLKTTGVKFYAYVQSATAYLGLKTTATRVIMLTRVNTALFGLKGIASRVITLIRADTALLGLLTTGTRAVTFAEHTATALLGLLSTGTRAVGYIRTNTALLGLKATGTRVIAIIRGATAILGFEPTGVRILKLIRTATAYLGLKAAGVRTTVLTKANTSFLGLKSTASRITAYARTGTALLGLKSKASRVNIRIRTNMALLGLKGTATRVLVLTRTDSALLGLKSTATRIIVLTRVDTALLGLKTTGVRIRTYVKSATALLGLTATGTMGRAYTRVATALLGLTTTGIMHWVAARIRGVPVPGLGRIRPRYTMGFPLPQIKYTLGKVKKGFHNLAGRRE